MMVYVRFPRISNYLNNKGNMCDLIDFQIDLKVADGHLETFKGLVAEMISFIKTEIFFVDRINHLTIPYQD